MGGADRPGRTSHRFRAFVVAATASVLTLVGTVGGMVMPVRAGTVLLLLMALGWMLGGCFAFLGVARRQRLARR